MIGKNGRCGEGSSVTSLGVLLMHQDQRPNCIHMGVTRRTKGANCTEVICACNSHVFPPDVHVQDPCDSARGTSKGHECCGSGSRSMATERGETSHHPKPSWLLVPFSKQAFDCARSRQSALKGFRSHYSADDPRERRAWTTGSLLTEPVDSDSASSLRPVGPPEKNEVPPPPPLASGP